MEKQTQDPIIKVDLFSSDIILNDQANNLVQCSIDSTHRVLPNNLNAHEEMCKLRKQGYGKDCIPFPAAAAPSRGTVLLDKARQAQVILETAVRDPTMKIGGAGGRCRSPPQTSDRLFTDFTTDERRALYDHVVSLTRGTMPELQEFAMPVVEDARSGPLTREQQMAMERDAKRRRVRHRALKVHTRSKNYSQVLREVINNQMSAYEDWLKAYHGAKGSDSCSKHGTETGRDAEGAEASSSKEMKWVEWDRKCNPHLWWKRVLERAKREEEMKRMSEMEEEKRKRRGCGSGVGRDDVRRHTKREAVKEYNERDSRERRRDGYDRDRDRYKDNRYSKRKRDHYEEEMYVSREREKRRRVYEAKRSRNYLEEDEEEGYSRKREMRRSKTESLKRIKSEPEEWKEHSSKREREKRRRHEDGTSSKSRVDLSNEPSCTNSAIKGQMVKNIVNDKDSSNRDLSIVKNEATEGEPIMDNLVQNVQIKQENVNNEITENRIRWEEASIEGDLLQTVDIKQEKLDESETCGSEQSLDDNLLHTVNIKQVVDVESDESRIGLEQASMAYGILEKVKGKLENGESLDDAEVRLAKEMLFKRWELIGKDMPSDMSSSDGESHDGRKNKFKKKKTKKSKQKSKKSNQGRGSLNQFSDSSY